MRPTDFSLNEQLRITNTELARRKEYIGLTESDVALLREMRHFIAKDVFDIVTEFYEHLVEIREVAELIGDSESLERLKNHLQRYILSLFSGQYDAEYVQTRLRIGLVHKRIGVPPKLYVSALCTLGDLLRSSIVKGSSKAECLNRMEINSSLEKILLFDLILVFDTYIHGLMDEVHRHKQAVENYAAGLEQTIAKRTEELAELSRTDSMTGLFNQRSFYEELRRELSRSQRRNYGLALCYIDMDGFKKANDSFGHQYGDSVLINLATVLKASLRTEAFAARYGGDEFCVILPVTDVNEALMVCRRIISNFSSADPECLVTLSIGIAVFSPESPLDAEMLVSHADSAMYQAKSVKGNSISVYGEEVITVK